MAARHAILVLGAGMAGLAAARDLARAGREVTVLEARDRVGGRIWSRQPPGASRAVELGAEFAHGRSKDLARLLRKAGLRRMGLRGGAWWSEKGRVREDHEAWDRLGEIFSAIPEGERRPFAEWLADGSRRKPRFSAKDRALATRYVQGFHAADAARMSSAMLRAAAEEGDSREDDLRLDGAYDRAAGVLADEVERLGARIVLQCRVGRVRWGRGRVVADTTRGTFRGAAAVVALPLGVLRAGGGAGAVRFEPSPPQARLWRQAGWGHVRRITLRLRPDAWDSGLFPPRLAARRGRAFGFVQSPREAFPVWWAHAPDPVVVGWTGGPLAEAFSGQPVEDVARTAMRSLARLLGRPAARVADQVVAWHTHDWSADPFARGAYSYMVAGGEAWPREMALPADATLFFAGEHTAEPLELGTVQGALASGRRAARQLARALPIH